MASSRRSNVLFVVLDTVRKDHLIPYGYERPTSPALESFADAAAVFDNAVAPAPWTLPVHASLFTGQYPSTHGATQESPYLEGAHTLAESLTAAGYATCCYSSNAWITPYTRLTTGFTAQDNFFKAMPGDFLSGPLARLWKTVNDRDRLRGLADRVVAVGNAIHERLAAGGGEASKTPAIVDRTIDFVDDSQGPFFAFINLMDAHLPYHPPAAVAEQFAPGVDSTAVCQNSKAYNVGARDIDAAEWTDIVGLYDAEIRHMDDQLGRLFDWLRSAGLYEETMIVVCADHGELHGEHGLYGHEFNVYDPLVNVPLLVKHPAIDAERRQETVELLDLYDTILDATNVDPLGRSLEPSRSMLSDSYRERDHGDTGFVEYHRPVVELNQLESIAASAGITLEEDTQFYSRMRAARRPDGKYIRNERIRDEAYRLDKDAAETDNLVGDEDSVIDTVEASLETFEAEVGGAWSEGDADPLARMDEAAKDRLRDLGYVE